MVVLVESMSSSPERATLKKRDGNVMNISAPLNVSTSCGSLSSTLNGNQHCCRVYQESAGFYHDYACVQSTLNLETRHSASNLVTFNPFVGARTTSGQFTLGFNGGHGVRADKSVQTEFSRTYKDEFLRSLAEIEGLKMKISTLSKELKNVKENATIENCHKQCEENLSKTRRALESREIAVLERDFLCYEYQEQEKVYKKRLADLEVGIVLGRQNYALKSITCEQVQADAAVKLFALILEKRPETLSEYVKKFEKSHGQWSKLATELSSLSGQTLKFYTNQLRALQENHAQLLELPVLPSISVTTEKGRDPLLCLGELFEQISLAPVVSCTSQLTSTPNNEEHSSAVAACSNSVWSRLFRPDKSILAPGSAANILCPNKARISPGILAQSNFSHDPQNITPVHPPGFTLGFCAKSVPGQNKNLQQTIFTTASGGSCASSRQKILSSFFSDHLGTSATCRNETANRVSVLGGDIISAASQPSACSSFAKQHSISSSLSSGDGKDQGGLLNPAVSSESHRQQCVCGVCGEPVSNVLSTRPSCNHVFHPKCAIMIDKCPVCLK